MIDDELRQRILILDGAMGTKIQSFGLTPEHYQRGQFAQWPVSLTGNNDILSLTAPEVIKEIHRLYVEAGADIIATNTFSSQRISQADYHLEEVAAELALAGARLVFVDIRPDTMNIDETKIEDAITGRTKAIIAVHYAGVACEMDTIMDIAARYKLKVIEDAAQGVMSTYKGRALGTIADFGCYSFHETKNYSMGEGGALVINHGWALEAAEILREKGTNRARFFRGQVDKYTWVDYGSSYLPSDMNAAYLWAQLQQADMINEARLHVWNTYHEALRPLAEAGRIEQPTVPADCVHNAHMYYIKLRDLAERTDFIRYMKANGVSCVFHYVPLHSSPAGYRFGRFHGEDRYTTSESDRLVRLPLYYGMTEEDLQTVIRLIKEYFKKD